MGLMSTGIGWGSVAIDTAGFEAAASCIGSELAALASFGGDLAVENCFGVAVRWVRGVTKVHENTVWDGQMVVGTALAVSNSASFASSGWLSLVLNFKDIYPWNKTFAAPASYPW
jgi:hypothetical protein